MQEIDRGAVRGAFDPRFEAVVDAFSRNFTEHGEVGGACAVYKHGRCVVDLWGGIADPANGRPWLRETTALAFSVAKGLTATCIHRLIEQGALDIDRPVADYWPEFGCNGKESITTRMVLTHRAGLAAVDGELTLEQVLASDPVVAAIAAQGPNWPPGTAHGYHARSFGWILGEIVRRLSGRSLGRYFADEIAAPLGLRLWIGLPEEEIRNCARLIPPAGGSPAVAALLGADSLTGRVMSGPSKLFGYDGMWNRPEVLRAEMPSSNGVGDARSLARFYAALIGEVDRVRLLSTAQLAKACEVQVRGPDKVILRESCFGLGYALQPFLAPGAGERAFGHGGAGGAVAFADPDAWLGFGYVMNKMQFSTVPDPRTHGLVRATYASLG
jgi:CubicO group peptidase (beta-lactamase class C family)